MNLPDNTPVIIGAAAVSQRPNESATDTTPADTAEASQLMCQAAEAAARDAGSTQALAQLELVAAMASLSGYLNPAKLVATQVGSPNARTLRADPGILQQEVFQTICQAIQQGELNTALVVSGEASYRQQQASIAGQPAPNTDDQNEANQPDQVLAPELVIHDHEIEAGLVSAVAHYAMLENAYRHHHGQSKAEQAQETAELWARFSQVAAGNPDAWNRQSVPAEAIANPSAQNRMMAFPYTKNHCSQMNVDQAAALLFCSAGQAKALGIAADRWIFPHAGVISNHAVPVLPRAQHYASPGFRLAGQQISEVCGVALPEVELVDLYSCFPVAVKTQAAELGLELERQLTITGGMAFAGGPFNSYVLHSLCAMVEELRQQPQARGLTTSISGMITKQGIGLWSAQPPGSSQPAHFADLTEQVAQLDPPAQVDGQAYGSGTVVTYTVLYERDKSNQTSGSTPVKGVAVVELGVNGTASSSQPVRRLATTSEADVIGAMLDAEEFCGQAVTVTADGELNLA